MLLALLLTWLAVGCAHWQPTDDPASLEGRQAAERLRAVNSGLISCKGLGRVSLFTPARVQRARLAWAAVDPSRLRLELLAPSGHPLAALASDGVQLYLRDNADQRFYKTKAPGASLQQLAGVPLKVADLIPYLMGRVPLAEAERYWLVDNPDRPGYILKLSRWWGAEAQTIELAEDGQTVRRVTHFDAQGNPAYWVVLADRRSSAGFSFPETLLAETPAGKRVEIHLERVWPNAQIDAAAFRLSP